ncbi:MAG: ABC transporter substrate-binding protein [Candidatus Melainabacteria bacterium]|nr:ABC transporter substrate-binding protein [Candidatus Melainabacteria bacterium]
MSLKCVTNCHCQGLIAFALSLSLLFSHGAIAASSRRVTEKELVETFIADVSRGGTDKNGKSMFETAARSMNFEEMAKRAFGESGWTEFSPGEQKEVTALFRRLIQIRYYPRWSRIFQKGRFEMTSQTKQGNDSLVAGTLNLDGNKNALTFRITKVSDDFKLVSMSVKDKDLLERTSVRLKRGLSKKGAAGLIAHLRKRTAEKPKDKEEKPQLEELISGGK